MNVLLIVGIVAASSGVLAFLNGFTWLVNYPDRGLWFHIRKHHRKVRAARPAKAKRLSPEMRRLKAAEVAVKDLAEYKAQRRIDERQRWRNQWEEIEPVEHRRRDYLPPDQQERIALEEFEKAIRWKKTAEKPPSAGKVRLQQGMTVHHQDEDGYDTIRTAAGAVVMQVATDGSGRTYTGRHLTTCPYECDCPQWARRNP